MKYDVERLDDRKLIIQLFTFTCENWIEIMRLPSGAFEVVWLQNYTGEPEMVFGYRCETIGSVLKSTKDLINRHFDAWVEFEDDYLQSEWDTYKYEHYCGELFHPDDCDFWDEELYADMCLEYYNMLR